MEKCKVFTPYTFHMSPPNFQLKKRMKGPAGSWLKSSPESTQCKVERTSVPSGKQLRTDYSPTWKGTRDKPLFLHKTCKPCRPTPAVHSWIKNYKQPLSGNLYKWRFTILNWKGTNWALIPCTGMLESNPICSPIAFYVWLHPCVNSCTVATPSKLLDSCTRAYKYVCVNIKWVIYMSGRHLFQIFNCEKLSNRVYSIWVHYGPNILIVKLHIVFCATELERVTGNFVSLKTVR